MTKKDLQDILSEPKIRVILTSIDSITDKIKHMDSSLEKIAKELETLNKLKKKELEINQELLELEYENRMEVDLKDETINLNISGLDD